MLGDQAPSLDDCWMERCHCPMCFNKLFIICILGILTEGLMTGYASKCLIAVSSLVWGLLFYHTAAKH